MTDQEAAHTPDVLDVLVDQILACGGPLSQMMASVHEFQASGLSSPDAPPPFEVAHSLIRSVVDEVAEHYSDDEIRVSAEIVAQVTVAICENIFIMPPSEIRRGLNGGASPGSNRATRQQPARRRQRRAR